MGCSPSRTTPSAPSNPELHDTSVQDDKAAAQKASLELGRHSFMLNASFVGMSKSRAFLMEHDPQELMEEADELAALGSHREALPKYELALKAADVRPTDGPSLNTVGYAEKLAQCYLQLKDTDKALPLLHRAMHMRDTVQGASHPETLAAVQRVAGCLDDMQHYDSSVPLYQRLLKAIQEPEMSEQGLSATLQLGECLVKAGRADEALPMLQSVHGGRLALLGAEHAHTLQALEALAMCYERLGQNRQAEPLLRQLLTSYQASTEAGPDHSDTMWAADRLAHCLRQLGETRQALPLLSKSLKERRRSLGQAHPDTIRSRLGMIDLLTEQGDAAEALPLLREDLDTARRSHHEKSMHIATAAAALAACLSQLYEWDEAVELYREAVQIGRLQYGDTAAADPDILRMFAGLAEGLEALPTGGAAAKQEALELWQQAAEGSGAVLGAQNPETVKRKARASALRQQLEAGVGGKPADAPAPSGSEPEPAVGPLQAQPSGSGPVVWPSVAAERPGATTPSKPSTATPGSGAGTPQRVSTGAEGLSSSTLPAGQALQEGRSGTPSLQSDQQAQEHRRERVLSADEPLGMLLEVLRSEDADLRKRDGRAELETKQSWTGQDVRSGSTPMRNASGPAAGAGLEQGGTGEQALQVQDAEEPSPRGAA